MKDLGIENAKFRFEDAFNQEIDRVNYLIKTYPDNARYAKAEANFNEIRAAYEYMCQYIRSQETRITLLQIENKLASADYMRAIDEQIDMLNIVSSNSKK